MLTPTDAPAHPGSTTRRRGRTLANLSPWDQVKAGRMPRRLCQLMIGLTLFGAAMGLFVRAGVGLEPWGVFHMGVSKLTGWSMGTVTVVTAALVLLLWIPLRQWPGLGTIANAVWLGIVLDATLALVHPTRGLTAALTMFATGLLVNALAGALYIGSQLGPGPRDGLMTGLHLRTGMSVRRVRTTIEVVVLAVGWLLGGVVGAGTIAYALLIGPLVQFFLPWCIVDLHASAVVENDTSAEGD